MTAIRLNRSTKTQQVEPTNEVDDKNNAAPASAGQPQDQTSGTEPTLRAVPSIQTRTEANARFNSENGGAFRANQLQQSFPLSRQGPPPEPNGEGTSITRGMSSKDGPISAGQRDLAVKHAIENPGQPQSFTNSDGTTEQLKITKDGDTKYKVEIGGDKFTAQVENGVDPMKVLPKAIDFYSETPKELRGAIKELEFKKGPGEAIDSTDDPNDHAAAQAGGGKITFFDGDANLSEGIFHHEAGHLIGGAKEQEGDGTWENITELGGLAERGDPVPDGYEDAAKKDKNWTTPYAEDSSSSTGYTEDFAEAWSQYMVAVDGGSQALQDFRNKYPERSKWLEGNLPKPVSGMSEYDVINNPPPGTI